VRDAVEHLLELGHRTVHHVSGPEDSQSSLIRRATWARCLQEAGREVPEPVPGGWEAAAGYEAGLHLAADPEVTAIFCANDELALGLIRAMHEQGRRVPQDVSVVGFDGLAVGEYSFPPLTTVRQDFKRHGREMVGLVLEQVASRTLDGSRSIIIPTELIVRGSTAPPAP
jgi:transcriptional regulator, lacI family